MRDALFGEGALDRPFDRFEPLQFADDDVPRQGVFGRADRPDVEVVGAGDPLHRLDPLLQVLQVELFGGAVQGQPQALSQDAPGGDEDQEGDGDADDRVDRVPARQADQEPREDDADRDERIGQHVQVGGADVDVARLVGGEEVGRKAVDRHADAGDDHDRIARDRDWGEELADALDEDEADGQQQDDGIGQRHENRALLVAVGVGGRRLAGSQQAGREGEQHAGYVAQVVPGLLSPMSKQKRLRDIISSAPQKVPIQSKLRKASGP